MHEGGRVERIDLISTAQYFFECANAKVKVRIFLHPRILPVTVTGAFVPVTVTDPLYDLDSAPVFFFPIGLDGVKLWV